MARKLFRTNESISGIARKGDLILLDTDEHTISVGHRVPWDEREYIMTHELLSCSPARARQASRRDPPRSPRRLHVI